MYPLLLKGGADEVTAMTLDLALAFGIPMAVGAAVLAGPILHLLNSQYLDASTALGILAMAALANTVTSFFDQVLIGKDRVDVDESAKFSDYLRSSILFVAKVNLALTVVYLASVYISVASGLFFGLPRATTLEVWALAQLGIFIVGILIKARRVSAVSKLIVPRSIGYYALGAGIMAVILYLLEPFIFYGRGTFFLALELVLVGGVGLSAYAVFVLALDKTLRGILRRALKEGFA